MGQRDVFGFGGNRRRLPGRHGRGRGVSLFDLAKFAYTVDDLAHGLWRRRRSLSLRLRLRSPCSDSLLLRGPLRALPAAGRAPSRPLFLLAPPAARHAGPSPPGDESTGDPGRGGGAGGVDLAVHHAGGGASGLGLCEGNRRPRLVGDGARRTEAQKVVEPGALDT